MLFMEQLFRHRDDHAPDKLDVFRLSARRTDKPQEVQTLALSRHQMDSPVVVDFSQQFLVQLVATLSTVHTVASLGLVSVSPEAATEGVTPIFPEKNLTAFFSHHRLLIPQCHPYS